jgi:hypothetical protein
MICLFLSSDTSFLYTEPAWGMKLGQKVGSIRNNGLYISNNEQRRQQLEKLGFVWRVRAATKSAVDSKDYTIPFDQIYDALVVYRNEIKPSGPLTVPVEFTVPDADPWPENTRGLPLGRSVEQLRSNSYLKQYPGAKEKLQEIGFETDKKLSANDARFQAVYLALERYKDIYGDLLVPQPFVVPTNSDDWPKESWGLRLGARVNAIRSQGTFVKDNAEREDMLDALGFVWTPPEKDVKKRGRKSLEEIDLEEKEILEATRLGQNLAGTGSPMTVGGYVGESEEDMDGDNAFFGSFDFSDKSRDGTTAGEAQPGAKTWGLEAGRQYDGSTMAAPREESNDDIEEEYISPRTLGESLAEARQRALESGIIEDSDSKRPTKRKREPDFPWYNDDFGGDFVFEDVVEALTLYKKFYGSFSNLTNDEFVIPFEYEPQPSFDDNIDYDADLSMKAVEVSRFDTIDAEAEISNFENSILLQQQVQASSTVAELAPISEVEWPEHLEGMRLGSIVQRVREGSLEVKHLPERKAQLDAIDFDWGDPLRFLEVPFEKAMCAMYAYYLVRGDMFVPADFIMPDEDPWPKALAGYEIGQAVKRIRELQNFFEAFHTEKVALLRMIDFVWFPTLALPIDPNEGEFDNEMLILGALGHPDISNLPEIPMGLPEKIMADGPFWTGDDPKQWWRKWHNWDYVAGLWHQLGKRDNAWWLRQRGMYKMAAEHEEKYGPGLFYFIDEFLDSLPDLLDEDVVSNLDQKQKDDYLQTIDGYLLELEGCTDQYEGISMLNVIHKILDPSLTIDSDKEKDEKGKMNRKGKRPNRDGDDAIESVFGRYTEEEVEDGFQVEPVQEEAVNNEEEDGYDDINRTSDAEDEYVDIDEEYLSFEEDLGLEPAEEGEIET